MKLMPSIPVPVFAPDDFLSLPHVYSEQTLRDAAHALHGVMLPATMHPELRGLLADLQTAAMAICDRTSLIGYDGKLRDFRAIKLEVAQLAPYRLHGIDREILELVQTRATAFYKVLRMLL